MVSYSFGETCTQSLLREAGWENLRHFPQPLCPECSEFRSLMCLLANRIQYFTLSHPFSPGLRHAVEFQKCLITLFNSKSVFINLFHSFIYFHRQFVIALSKPFDKFLSHSCPCTAILTDNEMKSTESLNASPFITFLCQLETHLPSTHPLWAGKGNEDFQVTFMSRMWKWYACLFKLYFCPSKVFIKTKVCLAFGKGSQFIN